ncbi:MAG: hypothetical protein DWQ07_20800 [Chloroflexi bacterium]|nr:MAG: hypothetical protein DWQ07_20800 [Chloroflexota bacterium]MBL1194524.1 hypothetical protein [Chloroflexota bacterium]NOH11812.1 hypothetical protein [Chloroflexota bacterium]
MFRTRNLLIFGLLGALLITACNLSSAPVQGIADDDERSFVETAAAATIVAQTEVEAEDVEVANKPEIEEEAAVETIEPAVTPTLVPTATPTPEPTADPGVCDLAGFVMDISIPDGAEMAPNENFVKTWRLSNNGTCTWTTDYELIFDSGDAMGGPASQKLTSAVVPGGTVDISVNLAVPNAAGNYTGNWKLRNAGGIVFALAGGVPIYVEINVVEPDPTATPTPNIPDWPIFKLNDSGPEVYAIKALLRAHGYNLLVANDKFNHLTRNKVIAFQTDKGIAVDGIVGPETWNQLIKGMTIEEGDTGFEVRALQHLLAEKWDYDIAIDGDFGPLTEGAVISFQTSKYLLVDGIVGKQTWQALIAYETIQLDLELSP